MSKKRKKIIISFLKLTFIFIVTISMAMMSNAKSNIPSIDDPDKLNLHIREGQWFTSIGEIKDESYFQNEYTKYIVRTTNGNVAVVVKKGDDILNKEDKIKIDGETCGQTIVNGKYIPLIDMVP